MADPATEKKRSGVAIGSLNGALFVYRFFAFLTGVVLLTGTLGLFLETFALSEEIRWLDVLWIAHGYLYMAYVLVTLNVAIHLRWRSLRTVLIMAAGTIPTMSFVAERAVTRLVPRST